MPSLLVSTCENWVHRRSMDGEAKLIRGVPHTDMGKASMRRWLKKNSSTGGQAHGDLQYNLQQLHSIHQSLQINNIIKAFSHRCENHCLAVWFQSTNITWLTGKSFPGDNCSQIPGCWGVPHPLLLLFGLWLFGCGLAVSNDGQLKIPQRWKQREGNFCSTTHPCGAKIVPNQMAPHRKLPPVCGPPSKKKKKYTSQDSLSFDSIPKVDFPPTHTHQTDVCSLL